MAKASNVVEINGRRYDANTGRVLGSLRRATAHVKPATGQAIDGFIRKPASKAAMAPKKLVRQASSSTDATMQRVQQAAQSVHKKTQKSRTLMRSAVHRPIDSIEKPAAKAPPKVARKSPSWYGKINPVHQTRADATPQHSKVNRFGKFGTPPSKPKETAPLKISAKVTPRAAAASSTTAAASVTAPLPSMVTSTSHQHLERLLDLALERADAHKKALRGRLPDQNIWQRFLGLPRWASLGATGLVLLLIGSFFAYQNIPNIAMRIASARTGLHGSVPSYQPDGFSYASPIIHSGQELNIVYRANADKTRSYTIAEKSSDWDSQSLLANFVIASNKQYQTVQSNGTTIYIYGENNNATWVSQGTWYTIKDAAHLNTDQLVSIASSI